MLTVPVAWSALTVASTPPVNRVRVDEVLAVNVLPKKGRLGKADRARVSDAVFVKMRCAHSVVETGINGLDHHGLDCIRAHGAAGFARMVSLSIPAFNIHRLDRAVLKCCNSRLTATNRPFCIRLF